MLNYLRNEMNKTFTENGAVTNYSSLSDCVDLFATIGAIRNNSDADIITRFMKAYAENADIATRILFYARDIRGGLGERHVFRTILHYLCNAHPETVLKNLEFVAEFGRFDDILVAIDTPCEAAVIELIKTQLAKDIENDDNGTSVSLLAKWLPSANTSNKDACAMGRYLAKKLGMTEAQYRKTLTRLRAAIKLVENNLREKDYTFDYSMVPSQAMNRYRKAFIKNDKERFSKFLDAVNAGEKTMNTSTLAPYEIIYPIVNAKNYWNPPALSEDDRKSINTMWNALEDFTNDENSIAVIDGSGSMYGYNCLPAAVAFSLGLYFAERNKGAFKNHFITFSSEPRLIEVKGNDIIEKLEYCMNYNEVANTNIQKVFECILNAAVKNNVKQEEMPSKVYIISDMEFDYCTTDASLTNFEYAKTLFESHGYKLPELVFWNVASRNIQQPVTRHETGTCLVSGCTPRIFSMAMSAEMTPETIMLETVNSERYIMITA